MIINKKYIVLTFVILALLAFTIIITKCSLDRNANWVYRDFKSRMYEVPYGDVITKIDIRFLRTIISIYITVEPDKLSKRELFILGKNLVNKIEEEYEINGSLKYAELLFIYPVSDNINEDFYYRRPTSERRWCFSGDLGNGQVYNGKYLDQMPDFEDQKSDASLSD